MSGERPALTAAAPAARPLLEILRSGVARETVETRAKLSGWVGARNAGCWDVTVSDAIALAAVDGVLDPLREWAAQEPEPQDRAANIPRSQVNESCQFGRHDRCDGYRWPPKVPPDDSYRELCECPKHNGAPLCWGSIAHIEVRP